MAEQKKSDDELLQQAQAIEQALHMQTAQRATLQAQAHELENASSELANAKESYRIIGNIMVKADASALKAELDSKRESLQHRITTLERTEQRLRDELKRAQEQVLRGEAR
jgi:prefoldin beta subunit